MSLPNKPDHHNTQDSDELPPFLGTWSRVYSAVLWYLAALIVVLYAFSRLFS